MKVLIIEDSQQDMTWAKEVLDEYNDEMFIDEAQSIEQAKHLVQENIYNCVLLDLVLIDCSGYETFKQLIQLKKKSDYNKDTPIVVLTGLKDYAIGDKMLSDGCQDYLIKENLTPDSLLEAVRFAVINQEKALQTRHHHFQDFFDLFDWLPWMKKRKPAG